MSTKCEAPHYEMLSILLLLSPPLEKGVLSILFSNTLNVHSSLIVRDQLSCPSKTSGTTGICIFNPYIFLQQMGRKNSEMNATF
jgi:hypothetical protein